MLYCFSDGATVKGCVFHFTQAINRHKDLCGLKTAYEQNPIVNDYIRVVCGAAFLPLEYVDLFLRNHFARIPVTADGHVNVGLQRFATYVGDQWQRPEIIPLWNQRDNNGPRTTNHAEGYHNGLRSKFDHRHPRLGEFLHFMQEQQNSFRRKIENLRDRVAFPKQRRPQDVWVDERIAAEIAQLDGYLNTVAAQGHGPTHNVLEQFCRQNANFLGQHRDFGG